MELQWTAVGVITGTCAACAAFMTAALLPKALTNQGYAVSVSLGITSIIYATSFVGKGFTGWPMEIIGRRWTRWIYDLEEVVRFARGSPLEGARFEPSVLVRGKTFLGTALLVFAARGECKPPACH